MKEYETFPLMYNLYRLWWRATYSSGYWYCINCEHHSRTRRNFSARKEQKRAASLGSQENPSNRCTRVVNAPEKIVGGCVLCRCNLYTCKRMCFPLKNSF